MKTKPVTIVSLAKLKGTTFCEMRLNGNLRRRGKYRPATVEVSLPDDWVDDVFAFCRANLGDSGPVNSEFFLMRVKASEIPD